MDILFVLIPLSVVLVFAVIAIFAWALNAGQFDDLEREGERIFEPGEAGRFPPSGKVDSDQAGR